jgi:hypothetical protein
VTTDFDQHLPLLTISDETWISSTRSLLVHARQVRQITSYCKDKPRIEHAQLIHDETIPIQSSNGIVYNGSLIYTCQYGFYSSTHDEQPVRITCDNGVFYPIVTCLGKNIVLRVLCLVNIITVRIHVMCTFAFKKNCDVHFHHRLICIVQQSLHLISMYFILR